MGIQGNENSFFTCYFKDVPKSCILTLLPSPVAMIARKEMSKLFWRYYERYRKTLLQSTGKNNAF